MTEEASSRTWGASGRTRHNVVSMTSQPPLRLPTFCGEANHILQGVVVDSPKEDEYEGKEARRNRFRVFDFGPFILPGYSHLHSDFGPR